MRKNKTALYTLPILLLFFSTHSSAQNHAAAAANADTTNFTPNKNGGWLLFNSYVAVQGADSVKLEFTIQHSNNINWTQEQYVGKIKPAALQPVNTRNIPYSLNPRNYSLKVQSDGKCYLKQSGGSAPPGNWTVLPVSIIFKK